jgi:hypothetical protein
VDHEEVNTPADEGNEGDVKKRQKEHRGGDNGEPEPV